MIGRVRWVLLTSLFIILIVLSFNFMLASRTRVGYAYDNIHPWFMPTFLITILVLAAMIVSGKGSKVKISSIIAVSLIACLFYSIVYDGGPGWDSWVHLGFERQVYDNVFYDAYG
ncbi:MAG: hypothetical protein ACFFBS_08650, partial [Promethearchaeota archaeon]